MLAVREYRSVGGDHCQPDLGALRGSSHGSAHGTNAPRPSEVRAEFIADQGSLGSQSISEGGEVVLVYLMAKIEPKRAHGNQGHEKVAEEQLPRYAHRVIFPWLASLREAIADPSNGLDILRMLWVGLQFPAQPPDVNIHGASLNVLIAAVRTSNPSLRSECAMQPAMAFSSSMIKMRWPIADSFGELPPMSLGIAATAAVPSLAPWAEGETLATSNTWRPETAADRGV
jgi:hypothetical protein